MPFRPNVAETITIDGVAYQVAEHPAAPGMPYGQEGRQGTVFQLHRPDGTHVALKVFKARFRVPALVTSAARQASYASIPGLEVCARTILTPRKHTDLLRQHPDLAYAILMPWINGPSWMDCLLGQRALTPSQALALARAFADLLATMEERGIAHGDLSGPNLLLPGLLDPPQTPPVALVDVEQLYAPGLDRPEVIVSGSSGYAHHTAAQGVWGATSDRFAGAMLLAEILGWSDPQIRAASGEESYFDPDEIQLPGQRYALLHQQLGHQWGAGVAQLFARAWESGSLAECPTLGEWLVALPNAPLEENDRASVPLAAARDRGPEGVMPLLALAAELRADKNTAGFLAAYRRAMALLPEGDGLTVEVRLLIEELEQQEAGIGANVLSVAAEHQVSLSKQAAPVNEEPRLTPEERRQIAADVQLRRRPVWPFVGLLVALLAVGGGALVLQARERDAQQALVQAATVVRDRATEQVEMSVTNTQSAEQTEVALSAAAALHTSEALAMLEGTASSRATEVALATADAEAASLVQTRTARTVSVSATDEAQRVAQQQSDQETATAIAQAGTVQAQAQLQTAQGQVQLQTVQTQAQRQTAQAEAARQTAQAEAQAAEAAQATAQGQQLTEAWT
jgi:DNA-binding protein